MAKGFYLGVLFITLLCPFGYAKEIITIAKEQRPQYKRDAYLNELLATALNAAQYPVDIKAVNVHPHQQRTLISLEKQGVDLYWSMTSPERETLALPIKVPLFKGYIGKRALLTKETYLSRFENITELKQLTELTAVQGHDWPDTKILVHNGLPVRPLANYQAMFAVTADGRVDYFPRSFIEVGSELTAINNEQLVIVPNVFISYPSAFYFFVIKQKPELAKALYKGLTIMKKNGDFDALFSRYFVDDLKALPFDNNTIEIDLANPYFQAQKKEP